MHPLRIIGALCHVYALCILVRAIFSWLPAESRRSEFYQFLYRITEPVLAPVRKALPDMGGIDLSPLVVIVVLEMVYRTLAGG
jgi:YggT family protein